MSETASVQDSPRKQLRGVAATARPGRRLGGRAKGTGNKIDGDIKKMVITALHYAGGVDYLVQQAHKHPVAFLGLVGRVLPLQVTGADGGRLRVEFSWADAPAPAIIETVAPVIEANAESNAIKDAVIVGTTLDDNSEVEVTFADSNDI